MKVPPASSLLHPARPGGCRLRCPVKSCHQVRRCLLDMGKLRPRSIFRPTLATWRLRGLIR